MKNTVYFLLALISLTGCKEAESDTVVTDAYQERYVGEYIHVNDAAAFTTKEGTYAVQIDEKSLELDEKAEEYKETVYDLVKVELIGELVPNPNKKGEGDGWDQMLKIDKIVKVSPTDMKAVQKLPKVKIEEDN